MSKKLMSVIMLNWNRLEYSRVTLERIIESSSIPIEIIIVDNNSMPESGIREYFAGMKGKLESRFEKVTYVYNSKNLGVAGGRNSGLVHATGEYLVTIDDDVLLPNKWDVLMAQACDNIPKLGITGVNVEKNKYPIKVINGVTVRPKNGNLGGACLCLPRRVFKRVGYYCAFGQYSHEDCEMFYRLSGMGLMSVYIVPHGKHLDVDADKAYRKEKNKAHQKGSPQLQALSKRLKYIRSGGDPYVAYTPYDPDADDIRLVTFTNDLVKGDRGL